MNYQDFKNHVAENILDYLPEKFANADVKVNTFTKNNDTTLDGLVIRTPESNLSPTIYLESFFDKHEYGEDMDTIMQSIAKLYQEHYVDHKLDVSKLASIDEVKDKLICKLVNKEDNTQFLEDKPFTEFSDLAVVYQINLGNEGETLATITLNNGMMHDLGVTVDELHEMSVANMEAIMPHEFKSMNEVVIGLISRQLEEEMNFPPDAAKEMAESMVPSVPDGMYVLTNDAKLQGAAALLNPEVMEQVAETMGSDYYVLPSSVHEVIIMPKNENADVGSLEAMVQEVNSTQVKPEDRLSDHVYVYDSQNKELVRADLAEERANEQKMEQDAPEKSDVSEKADSPDRAENADRTETADRTDSNDRTENADRSESADRTESTDRTEKSDRAESTDRVEKSERGDRSEKSERAEKREEKTSLKARLAQKKDIVKATEAGGNHKSVSKQKDNSL